MTTQNIFNLTDQWNNVATTFTAIKMNATDTASAATSMLIDLQVDGTTQFHVLKSGAVHTKRSNYNITSANTAIITASNYSLTGTNAQSLADLSGTWNTSGTPTAIKLNVTDTASAAGSLLIDLQKGGVSQFKVAKDGTLTTAGHIIAASGFSLFGTNVYLGSGAISNITSPSDGVITLRDANVTSFGRLQFGGTSNSFGAIARDGAGISIVGGAGGSTAHIKVPGVIVASLPAAATAGAGARSFVTDALAPTFGSAVTGGGAVNVPVYSTGAAWFVG